MDVLRDRLGGHAPNVEQCRGPEDGPGAAPEGGLPPILGGEDQPVEDRLLVEGAPLFATLLVFERVHVVEVLRGLHDGDPRILEVTKCVFEEVLGNDVVGIDDSDDLGVDVNQSVVDVACLGVSVLLAGQVSRSEADGQPLDLGAVSVVEHPGLVFRLDDQRCADHWQQHLNALVVGGDEHCQLCLRFAGLLRAGDGIHVPQREREETQTGGAVHFQQKEWNSHEPGTHIQRPEGPPCEVGGADHQGGNGNRPDEQAPAEVLGLGKPAVGEAAEAGAEIIRSPLQPRVEPLHVGAA